MFKRRLRIWSISACVLMLLSVALLLDFASSIASAQIAANHCYLNAQNSTAQADFEDPAHNCQDFQNCTTTPNPNCEAVVVNGVNLWRKKINITSYGSCAFPFETNCKKCVDGTNVLFCCTYLYYIAPGCTGSTLYSEPFVIQANNNCWA